MVGTGFPDEKIYHLTSLHKSLDKTTSFYYSESLVSLLEGLIMLIEKISHFTSLRADGSSKFPQRS